jgi:hypothetical protein
MAENLDVLDTGVSLLIRAVLLAARFSGRVRRRSLKRLAAMDTDAKAKAILFLKDLYYDRKPEKPKRDAKAVPDHIEHHVFPETRLTAYRLKDAA